MRSQTAKPTPYFPADKPEQHTLRCVLIDGQVGNNNGPLASPL